MQYIFLLISNQSSGKNAKNPAALGYDIAEYLYMVE
jgi:hypothetical protein